MMKEKKFEGRLTPPLIFIFLESMVSLKQRRQGRRLEISRQCHREIMIRRMMR